MLLILVLLGGCVGPGAAAADAGTQADAMEYAADECSDQAWEMNGWIAVLHEGVASGDLTTADVEWISRQMDYAAGIFRVCEQD